jgi:hypothetical protein
VRKAKPKPKVKSKPVGRPPVKPSVNDPAAVQRLCDSLATGMSVRVACDQPDVPSRTDVYIRIAKDDEFRTIIARAREAQAGALIDGTLELSDTATAENWQVVRMQIWARQWYASKVAARTYGDKLQHANAAGDGNTEVIYRWKSPDDETEG